MDAVSYSKASSAYKLAGQAIVGLTTKADLTTSGILVPVGTTATRPTLGAGEAAIRYNTDVGGLEEWNGTGWSNVSADITAVAIKGTDTVANILAKTGMVAEDLWIASDTLDGYVYDGSVWINIGPLQGPQGAAGISAYQVALNNGFVGTEVEWLASLVGPQGVQGITGNGVASVVRTNTVGLVDTYTITFTDTTTTTFNVTNGLNGTNGVDGQDIDHVSKTSGTGAAGTTDTYTVWGDLGETINLGTFTVYNGVNGAGTVAGVIAGTNVVVDNTDPTNPIINVPNMATIDDSLTTLTNTWSASKINSMLGSMDVSPIVIPTITTPTTGAIDFTGAVTATYTTSASYVGVQDWVRWEAGNSDFSVIYDSYEGASNLLSWTPSIGLALTTVHAHVKQGSDGHRSGWSPTVSFTTPNIYIETPTLTVTGTPADVPETPTLTTSAFSVFNGSDTHTGTTFTVKDGGVTVWAETKTTGDLLTTTVPAGILEVSTEYTFEAFHTGATYGNSGPTINTGTTKASFSIQYGLQWNNTADTYTRLGAAASWTTGADFTNNETVQSLMRRCVLNANGTVNYYLSATDSTKKADGVTASNLTGVDGNVMVEIPKFWVKYDNTTGAKEMWISTSPAVGYVVHPAFVKNGVEIDYRYYRAYKGSVSGTKLISRSGVAAAGNETIVAFRTKAKANGTGWGLVDWHLLFAVQTLLFIEIGTFKSQAVLGNGNDTGSDYGMTTGGSNSIGNASSPATNDDTWMSYRGIENFYADIFEWIDGVNFSERLVYTSKTQSTFASDVFSGDYTSTGVTLPSSGYISNMNFSTKGFIPTTSGGSDSTYVTDYVNSDTGSLVAAFGGYAGAGLLCGAACLYANYDSSFSYSPFGAGLSF